MEIAICNKDVSVQLLLVQNSWKEKKQQQHNTKQMYQVTGEASALCRNWLEYERQQLCNIVCGKCKENKTSLDAGSYKINREWIKKSLRFSYIKLLIHCAKLA